MYACGWRGSYHLGNPERSRRRGSGSLTDLYIVGWGRRLARQAETQSTG